jgi:creatinine amidohydrolase/Fe(II)-dependent formamide hydrolase-like protein
MRVLAGLLLSALVWVAEGAVLEVATLNTAQVAALDRDRTVVVLPGGILEQHGPFLPSYTDGYASERLGAAVAQAAGARDGWDALLFPQVPLGSSAANEIGGRWPFPGSFTLRNETLRAVYMDLADQLAEAGFRWVLVVHLHGAPLQNRMLDEASDYFREVHGGRMLHLYGLMRVQRAWGEGAARLAPEIAATEGFCVHVCIDETSVVLHLRPDLVDPSYRDAAPLTGADISELRAIAQQERWPGYFGTPRHARAEYGRAVMEALEREMVAAVHDLLDGREDRLGARFSDVAGRDPGGRAIDAAALEREARFGERQRRWLEDRGARAQQDAR